MGPSQGRLGCWIPSCEVDVGPAGRGCPAAVDESAQGNRVSRSRSVHLEETSVQRS